MIASLLLCKFFVFHCYKKKCFVACTTGHVNRNCYSCWHKGSDVIVGMIWESDYEMFNGAWNAEDKKMLKAITSFEFIYSLTTLQRSLLYLKDAVIKLQSQSLDMLAAYSIIEESNLQLKALRSDVGTYAQRIFEHSSRIAEHAKIVVAMPRVSKHQHHRSNPPIDSVEEYFKVTIVIPFLDYLISDLSNRFDSYAKTSASLQGLLPVKITSESSLCDIKQAVEFYEDDLPNSCIIDEEFVRWKVMWLSMPVKDRPQTLSESLQCCSTLSLPNIHILLKLFAMLPFSTCLCERSASALRRLNSYLRCTQSEERLSALALIHSYTAITILI